MQILAFGAEDIYLTGNPKLSFFKSVYKRHTNFAIECIEQNFVGTADFDKEVRFTIERNGDLVYKIYYKITLPALSQTQSTSLWVGYANGIGHVLLKEVSVELGSHIIDTHDSQWLDGWHQLTNDDENVAELVGDLESDLSIMTNALEAKTYYIPLQFWFCRNTGSSLPLVGLQYHEVVITTTFRDAASCIRNGAAPGVTATEITTPVDTSSNAIAFSNPRVLIEYIFLDDQERLRFSQKTMEYIIDTVQYVGDFSVSASATKATIDIKYFHPCKEFVWMIQSDADIATHSGTGNKILTYSDLDNTNKEMFKNVKVMMHGMNRFAEREAKYFRSVHPMEHHTKVPSKRVHVYSFSLHPEKYQPSGSANLSVLENVQLIMNFESTNAYYTAARTVRVYCLTYNILKIQAGLGGVRYAN